MNDITTNEITNAEIETSKVMFESVILAGQSALKACIRCNGFFLIIAFYALNIDGFSYAYHGLLSACLIFGLSMGLGMIATGLTYLTQTLYNTKNYKYGTILNWITIAVTAYGFIGYFVGLVFICKSMLGK